MNHYFIPNNTTTLQPTVNPPTADSSPSVGQRPSRLSQFPLQQLSEPDPLNKTRRSSLLHNCGEHIRGWATGCVSKAM